LRRRSKALLFLLALSTITLHSAFSKDNDSNQLFDLFEDESTHLTQNMVTAVHHGAEIKHPFHRDELGTEKQAVTSTALRYIGAPYLWAGTGIGGFDCSGLIYRVFQKLHRDVPRTADAQYFAGSPVSRDALQPGDLVFFSTYTAGVSHVGIYIGNDRFVHASPRFGVSIARLSNCYFVNRYVGARRIEMRAKKERSTW